MTFDDIDYPLDGHAYVWVKPAEGTNWSDVLSDDRHSNRGDEYRPGKLGGTPPEDEYRGTQIDGRRIQLIGQPYTYRLEKFELGGEMSFDNSPAPKM